MTCLPAHFSGIGRSRLPSRQESAGLPGRPPSQANPESSCLRRQIPPAVCSRCTRRDGTPFAPCARTQELALMLNRQSMPAIPVTALAMSADFEQLVQAAFGSPHFALSIVREGLRDATLDVAAAGVVVVDLDSTQGEQFLALD